MVLISQKPTKDAGLIHTDRVRELVLMALDSQDFPSLSNARQTLVPGTKHPESPVLRPRLGEWDGTRAKVYGTVLFDAQEGLFKMWYAGGTDYPDAIRRNEGAPRHLGYAYSHDGVHWQRPKLGIIEFNGSKDNNLVHLNGQAPTVFLQEDAADSSRRFVMFAQGGLRTHHNKILYSPDGLRWTQSESEPIDSATQQGTHEPYCLLHDPLEPDPAMRWKGYSLLHPRHAGYRGRSVGLFVGPDPEHWAEYPTQPILGPFDGMESEIHSPYVTRFYDTYVMLYDAMEPNHKAQTEIAISYDGIHFQRVQNGVKVVPNGKAGEADAGKIVVSPNGMFVHEGKIWWYYTVSADTYQIAPRGLTASPWYRYVGLSQWRQDGFAALQLKAVGKPAVVTTRSLKVNDTGVSAVWLNAATAPGDALTVEVLDAGGQVLATSQPWQGDHLRGAVQWTEQPHNISPGEQVTLRMSFVSVGTRLYAVGISGISALRQQASSVPLSVRNSKPQTRNAISVRWTFQAQTKISGSPTLDGDTVYAGSWDHHLYALNATTGDLRWKFTTGNAITAAPAVHNSIVYTGSHDGNVYAVKAESGDLLWKVYAAGERRSSVLGPNGAWIDGSPTVGAWLPCWDEEAEAPQRLFIGAHDRNLHAFNPQTGFEEWRFPTFNWILSQPFVANYTVYFSSMDGYIYAVDTRCGALLWRYRVGRSLRYAPAVVPNSVANEAVCGSPLLAQGTIYCGADDGFLYALDAATGQERWLFQTEKWIWGRPLLAEGVLMVASADGRVYGLDANSGKPIWRTATENANYADVVSWKGLGLVACTSGRLYALHPKTGKVVWTFDADAGLRAAPGIGADQTIYLPTCAGTLYALGHA